MSCVVFLISAINIGAIIALNQYTKDSQPKSEKDLKDDVTSSIIDIFYSNRQAYGTWVTKHELTKKGKIVSRLLVARIMKEQGVVSTYTLTKFKTVLYWT